MQPAIQIEIRFDKFADWMRDVEDGYFRKGEDPTCETISVCAAAMRIYKEASDAKIDGFSTNCPLVWEYFSHIPDKEWFDWFKITCDGLSEKQLLFSEYLDILQGIVNKADEMDQK